MFHFILNYKQWLWFAFVVFGVTTCCSAQQLIECVNMMFNSNMNTTFWQHSIEYSGSLLIAGGLFLLCYTKSNNLWWATIVILAHHLVMVFINAVNFPLTDDYGMLLDFANNFISNQNSAECLTLLTSTYNETRPALNRLLFLCFHYMFGSINFKTYIVLVNILFLAIIPCIYFLVNRNLWQLTIFAMLVLSIFSYDTYLWASTANYMFCVMFAFMSILFASKAGAPSFILSLLAGVACLLSFGNGIILFPLLSFIHFANKKYWRASITIMLSIVLAALYFRHYSHWPTQHFSVPSLYNIFLYAFIFAGSSFQFMYQYLLPALVGSILFAAFIFLIYKKVWQQTPLVYLLMFLWGSAFVASLFRSGMGLTQAFSNRYIFYSLLLIAFTILNFIHLYPTQINKHLKLIICCCLAVRLLGGIFFYPEAALRKEHLMELQNQYCNGQPLQPDNMIVPGESNIILDVSSQNKLYDCRK